MLVQCILGREGLHAFLAVKRSVVGPRGHVLVKSGLVIERIFALIASEVVDVFPRLQVPVQSHLVEKASVASAAVKLGVAVFR